MFKPKYNTDIFIKECRVIHNNYYDYSKVEYVGIKNAVTVICPRHGEFKQSAEVHLRGNGCKSCGVDKRSNKKRIPYDVFLADCVKIHGDKYDYSETKFNGMENKISIICKIHGKFEILASSHKSGAGCKVCNDDEITKRNINKFNNIYKSFYDYSLNEKIVCGSYIKIICPIHGVFEQEVSNHLLGRGCQKCSEDDRLIIENEKVLSRIKSENFVIGLFYNDKSETYIFNCKKHGHYKKTPMKIRQNNLNCPVCSRKTKKTIEYYQSLINERKLGKNNLTIKSDEKYLTVSNEYVINCELHGDFRRKLQNFISNPNCSKCPSNLSDTVDEFILKAEKIHGNLYDYSRVNYINNFSEIIIVCPEHGEFKCQPRNHTSYGRGCPKCAKCNMSNGEKRIKVILDNRNINYETQKTFDGCKNISKLRFDFYLPEYNMAIEYNGEQHYKPIAYFGDKESSLERYKYINNNDKIKIEFCLKNNIKLLVIPYNKFRSIEKIIITEIENVNVSN